MQEEKIEFIVKNVFYNPNMQFSRSFCSLAVGAIDKPIKLLDAFCASGIRGIRYAMENKNVLQIAFLDLSKNAIKAAKNNVKKNKVKNAKIINDKLENFLIDTKKAPRSDFIEVDPFGSPVQYLNDSIRYLSRKKESYISITATDVAVLCGPAAKACLKNYHSKSLNNEFTHENGTRILIKRLMETANEFNFAILPLFSLSDRHYIKLFLKLEKSSEKVYENCIKIGYISYCNFCGWRNVGKRMINSCKNCKKETDYAGPMWLGNLHDKQFLKKMLSLNARRSYEHKTEIAKTLRLMISECDLPPSYYNLHILSKKLKLKNNPKIESLINAIKKNGCLAARTHFNDLGIKSNCSFKDLIRIMKRVMKVA